MNHRLIALFVVLSTTASPLLAQGTKADYERARTLAGQYRDKVTKTTLDPTWSDNGEILWYRNTLERGESEFVAVTLPQGKRAPAFDHDRLAKALAAATKRDVRSRNLPFNTIIITKDGIHFEAYGKSWRFDPTKNEVAEAPMPPSPRAAAAPRRPGRRTDAPRRFNPPSASSPDGKWRVTVKDHNLVLRNSAGEETALTKDGTANDRYTGTVYWAPDSTRFVAIKLKQVDDRKINLIESSPRDQLQPKLHTLNYNKPGDPLSIGWPHLFEVESKKEIPISRELCSTPYAVDRMRWAADSSEFRFMYNQRGHQTLRWLGVNAKTGTVRAIVDEKSSTFIDYAHKTYLHEVPKTDELIWMSERDGWCHLYLVDSKKGSVKNQVTRGEWIVRGVDRVDDDKREIWFCASGIDPTQDPYYIHYCRINFDGTGLVRLTEGDGTHTVNFSPNREFLINSYSRVDCAPVHELRRCRDGSLVCKLESADTSRLVAAGWKPPERFTAKGRDGKTDIFGLIYRPTRFDPAKKYPVIEDIYAGPQGSFVPKAFAPTHGGQSLAELGFIVVKIDGMGTSNRSKAFHDVCCKNLGDAGFPDRIAWIKAAGAKYPQMDLSRVGLHGGSAGGQNALRGLLAHGDFYKVGVASCGCHDNRMDKIWWNELWMGFPIGKHYEDQSNVTQAHKLTGKLLLIVGEMDRNVDPASTMQVVNALIKADKDFDLLVVPGAGHGNGGAYGYRRLQDFFVRHLLGVEPRRE